MKCSIQFKIFGLVKTCDNLPGGALMDMHVKREWNQLFDPCFPARLLEHLQVSSGLFKISQTSLAWEGFIGKEAKHKIARLFLTSFAIF